MQDFRAFDDGNGRIFIGGDRRMRPNNNNYQNQVMKCPRCDSPNTKFCYYNNYNLSQPRHYCKSCRRYWTKGGVLRNVPVGGSCRKAKRSKPKSSVDTASADVASAAASVEINSTSNCGSESSSLSATTMPIAVVSAVVTDSSHFTAASFSLPEPRFFVTTQTATVTESNDSTVVDFNNSNPPCRLNSTNNNHRQQQQQLREDQQQWLLHEKMARNYVNDEPEVNLEEITTGLTQQVDWQINGTGGGDNEESLLIHQFTAGAVDQSYWSQNQWSDHDHSLY